MLTASTTTDIIMKSRLEPNMDQVIIEVQLASGQDIGFELKEIDGRVIYKWKDQYLDSGTHALRLKLPEAIHGKFILGLVAEDNDINHILFISE